ncbi:MAG: sigma-70 family RNA polymerase sigma factor [Vicinamibacteraceae bacterium]
MDAFAASFESHRPRLHAVAHRMLGSSADAEDVVQDAWLRTVRAGPDGIDNLGGWLTTVVARLCLDRLRARTTRAEDPIDDTPADEPAAGGDDPERATVIADALGVALLVVLETLSPPERVAFVLHDLFDLPFDDIAPIVGRTPAAARQLASRARRRVQGGAAPTSGERPQRAIVAAFLAAARSGDVEGLLAVLAPDVVVRADGAAVRMGSAPEIHGATATIETFANRARAAQPATVGGAAGLVWAQGGVPRVAFVFTVAGGRITAIELAADESRLAALAIVLDAG